MADVDAQAPAVFLDRDGTLMRDVDYCGDPDAVEMFADVPDALASLKDAGYKLIVITNQSGIGRGYFTVDDYRAVNERLFRAIGRRLIDGAYHCPHTPGDECECRKPSPRLVLDAAREHSIDLARSFFIGDKSIDLQCGRNAGLTSVLVRTGYGVSEDPAPAAFVAENLMAAAGFILHG